METDLTAIREELIEDLLSMSDIPGGVGDICARAARQIRLDGSAIDEIAAYISSNADAITRLTESLDKSVMCLRELATISGAAASAVRPALTEEYDKTIT